MRLIDADALLAEAMEEGAYGYVDAKQIADAPTIDAVLVKHGEWVKKEVYGEAFYLKACSVCGFYHGLTVDYNFCPNCGAKMDGGGKRWNLNLARFVGAKTFMRHAYNDSTRLDVLEKGLAKLEEVVRCEHCRHRKKPECPMCDYVRMMSGTQFRVIDRAEDNGFCHMGERKDDADK